ncbi:hypothetical protein D3C73_1188960 [compost metagenome]
MVKRKQQLGLHTAEDILITPAAAHHIKRRTDKLHQRMMQLIRLLIQEKRNAIIREQRRNQRLIIADIPHKYGHLAVFGPFLAGQAEHLPQRALNLCPV